MKQENVNSNLFNIPFHSHTGADSPKIKGSNLLGFKIVNEVPTYQAVEGTIILYDNKTDTRAIYVRMNNAWYSVLVT